MVKGFDIKFQVEDRVFSFAVGHKTKFFGHLPLMMLVELWFDENMNVEHAKVLWDSDRMDDKSNLIALLEGLEVRNIEEMLSKKPNEFKAFGEMIRRCNG